MNRAELCVVIPCAGRAARLAVPYPKELLSVGREVALIDSCIELLRDSGLDLRIVVVIGEHKLETVKYLSKYKDEYNLVFVYQRSSHHEMTGAIESAAHLLLACNLILFPDTIIRSANPPLLLRQTIAMLSAHEIAFWICKSDDHHVLAGEGAVSFIDCAKGLRVIDCVDKPKRNLHLFNAYWAALAFQGSARAEWIDVMKQMIVDRSETAFCHSRFCDAPALTVEESWDMGTWPNIYRYFGANSANER